MEKMLAGSSRCRLNSTCNDAGYQGTQGQGAHGLQSVDSFRRLCGTFWRNIAGIAVAQPPAQRVEETMAKVVTDNDGEQITAPFEGNAAARDFLSLLPMTLTLDDYSCKEIKVMN
jgi:hypothetical protein